MNATIKHDFENEMANHLTDIKVQSVCLTDEDWEVLGVSPGEAFKTGYHQGFYEAWRLLGKKEASSNS